MGPIVWEANLLRKSIKIPSPTIVVLIKLYKYINICSFYEWQTWLTLNFLHLDIVSIFLGWRRSTSLTLDNMILSRRLDTFLISWCLAQIQDAAKQHQNISEPPLWCRWDGVLFCARFTFSSVTMDLMWLPPKCWNFVEFSQRTFSHKHCGLSAVVFFSKLQTVFSFKHWLLPDLLPWSTHFFWFFFHQSNFPLCSV